MATEDTVEIITNLEDLTDEDIRIVKEGNANVIVTIGMLGSSVAILNPTSASAAIKRYEEVQGHAPGPGDTVFIVGFDDVFHTYQLSAI